MILTDCSYYDISSDGKIYANFGGETHFTLTPQLLGVQGIFRQEAPFPCKIYI